ncbi:MAG: ATP synthase F1 subunit gamma [Candidatus Syntrophonatronum acetioxidans]|uniref:ATP synthase gamma chain n=1 Tax=Candidatus Syntrophonatronum acetioxidans TaxID=1795816 RepID=A0A424YFZ0_9FIRM|nr:MAG: ATP synthase F1 subunit gamma [Candidatus Syntrophonatronum acetioxidans]
MKALREIRRRIRSVKNTQQITRAMEMVAAAKLRRAQERAESARPYAEQMKGIVSRLVSHMPNLQHELVEQREVKNSGFLVIAADRGLCGGYNSGLVRFATSYMEDPAKTKVTAVGKKSRDYYKRRNYELFSAHLDIEDYPEWRRVKDIGQEVVQGFREEEFDELFLVYTEFINPARQEPRIVKLLPMEPVSEEAEQEEKKGARALYSFEPDEATIIQDLLPKYIENLIYHALLEAKASEHAARMTAMRNATDNADEMIDSLTMQLNRARQASITQEILEVSNAAMAAEG